MDLGAHMCGYRMPANNLKSSMVVSNPHQLLMALRAAPHGAMMVRFELAGCYICDCVGSRDTYDSAWNGTSPHCDPVPTNHVKAAVELQTPQSREVTSAADLRAVTSKACRRLVSWVAQSSLGPKTGTLPGYKGLQYSAQKSRMR